MEPFYLLDVEDPQIGAPSMAAKERIVIRGQILRWTLPCNRVVKHTAYGDTIDIGRFNTDPNDPTGEYVHDEEHPKAFQQ